MELSASSWQNTQAKLLSTATLEAKTRSIPTGNPRNSGTKWNKYLYFKMTGVETTPKHSQIHIDIDNNPKTGFQFENEVWSTRSGVDYIIEDGHLYKSTANDSSWSWKWVQACWC